MRERINVQLKQSDATRMRECIQGVLNINDLDQGLRVARDMEAALVDKPLSTSEVIAKCLRFIVSEDIDLQLPEQHGFDLVVMVPVTELFGSDDDAAQSYINSQALDTPYYDLGSRYEVVGFTAFYSKYLVEQLKKYELDLPPGAEFGQVIYINIRCQLLETMQQISAVDGPAICLENMKLAIEQVSLDHEGSQKVQTWLRENGLYETYWPSRS